MLTFLFSFLKKDHIHYVKYILTNITRDLDIYDIFSVKNVKTNDKIIVLLKQQYQY